MKSGTRNVVVSLSLWMGWVIDSCMLWLMIESSVTGLAGVLAAARVVKHSQSRWTMFGWAAGARAARSTFNAVHDLELLPPPGSLRTTTIFVRD